MSDGLYCGYRLLACDGSDVNITRAPSDERTFIHEGEKVYNAVHINEIYDITNKTYCDSQLSLWLTAAMRTLIPRNRNHASHTKASDICQVQPKISYQPPTKEK